MKPVDFLTHLEFDPVDWWIVWFTGEELVLTDFIKLKGKNDRIIKFLEKNLKKS